MTSFGNISAKSIVREQRIQLLFFLGSLAALFYCVVYVQNVLVAFLLAIVGYYILRPMVDLLERRGFTRSQSVVIPFFALAVSSLIGLMMISPQFSGDLSELKSKWPQYQTLTWQRIQEFQNHINSTAGSLFQLDIEKLYNDHALEFSKALFQSAPDMLSKSLTVLLLAPFFSFFMLLHGRSFLHQIIRMVPNNFFELTLNLTYQIGYQLGGFIRARLIETLIVFVMLWTGLQALHFPYAIVFAVLAAVLNIIPYLGPIIGIIPPAFISLAVEGSGPPLAGLVILFVIVQLVDAVVLVPFLVAKIVDLHPIMVVLAILWGAQTMGVMGMIICIPLAATLRVTGVALYKHFTGFRL